MLGQVSAAGLKSADRNRKSDPFAKLSLAGQRAKSKTCMETLDPQWDEHFEFAGVRGELVRRLQPYVHTRGSFTCMTARNHMYSAEAQPARNGVRLGPVLD